MKMIKGLKGEINPAAVTMVEYQAKEDWNYQIIAHLQGGATCLLEVYQTDREYKAKDRVAYWASRIENAVNGERAEKKEEPEPGGLPNRMYADHTTPGVIEFRDDKGRLAGRIVKPKVD